MQHIQRHGGIIVYMPNEGRGIGLGNKVKAYDVQDRLNLDTFEANEYLGFGADERCYDFLLPVLQHYKIESMVLLTNNREKYGRIRDALSPHIDIVLLKPIVVRPTRSNAKYLKAKDERNNILMACRTRGVDVPMAVKELQRGRPIIVVDDETRENEGDLIMPAEKMTDEWMAFFVRHTSGIICCAMSDDMAGALELPPMVPNNCDPHQTAFTVSVDHATCTTGISARERALTCRALATSTHPSDFRRPGHVFPLVARSGGVHERRGHTEAAVDLCRLSGMRHCAVLSEITTADGMDMARTDDLTWFANEHDMVILGIDALASFKPTQ